MPFSGPNYSPPSGTSAVTNTPISSSKYNALINDLASALTSVVTRDGAGSMSGDLNINGHTVANLADPSNDTDAAPKSYVDDAQAASLQIANDLSDLHDVPTARTNLGLGSIATQDASAYATAAQGTKADGATQATDLASTSNGKGASLVGVQDSAGNFTGSTVEAVLAELATSIAAASLGVGQTWQDVKSSRTAGTVYQNTTGKPIQLKITFGNGAGDFLYEGATNTPDIIVGKSVASAFNQCYPIIPNNHYYKVTGSINEWMEFR